MFQLRPLPNLEYWSAIAPANLEKYRYMATSRLNTKLGKHRDALGCAEKALEIEKDCLGTDHEHYQETLAAVQMLRASNLDFVTR